MLESSPTVFQHIRTKRQDGSGCAVCATIEPCPPCKKGFQCQQIFRSSCQTCPVNKCVPIDGASSGSGSNSSSLGGALGGVLGAVAIAVVVFFLWRRSKKKRIALEDDAKRRSELAAIEKRGLEKGGVTIQLGGNGGGGGRPGQPDLLDNDTEWTQLEGNALEGVDKFDTLQEPTVFKRRSFGAATHLSKITEGAEEEEEEEEQNGADGANGGQAAGRPSNAGRSSRHGRDSSISSSVQVGAGPRISVGSGTTFSSGQIIPITFRPSPAGPGSPSAANGVPISPGAPTLGSSPLSMPAPAHRAVGTPIVEITNVQSSHPLRPARSPHLNLRLADGAEPGKKPVNGSLSSSTDSDASHLKVGGTSSSMLSPNMQAGGNGRKPSFMATDPTSALQQSRVYARAEDRPLSTATVNTFTSVSTAGLDYVLSAPQIITPITADGARRVQLNKGGKAQLVRGGSLKRKDGASYDSSPASTPSATDHGNPFSDAAAPVGGGGGAMTTSPVGDILLRPNGGGAANTQHMSTSTLGIPFADEMFALKDPKGNSPVDADRSSWLGGRTSFARSSRSGADEDEEGIPPRPRPSMGSDDDDDNDDANSPFSDLAAEVAASIPLPDSARATPRPSSSADRTEAGRGSIDARSSRAESIGGLSVFDQFPIAIGKGEPLPAGAQRTVMSFTAARSSSSPVPVLEEEEEGEEMGPESGAVMPRST